MDVKQIHIIQFYYVEYSYADRIPAPAHDQGDP
jgi:hypothetical protein